MSRSILVCIAVFFISTVVFGERITSEEDLTIRLNELKEQYKPYLRSLPKPIQQVRRKKILDENWISKYEIETAKDSNRPRPQAWYGADFNDKSWDHVSVPEWRYRTIKYRTPVSCILWYRKNFTADKPSQGERVILNFGGVDWHAQVWVNGKYIGEHISYYEPFEFDITDAVEKENVLAVRILNGPYYGEPRAYASILPLVPAEDQRYTTDPNRSAVGNRKGDLHCGSGYGIFRDVYLEYTKDVYIEDIFARGNPKDKVCNFRIFTDSKDSFKGKIQIDVFTENFEGKDYSFTEDIELKKGKDEKVYSFKTSDFQSWSPDSPCLYRCHIYLKKDGEVFDSKDSLFGYRNFTMLKKDREFRKGTLMLNDDPIYIRGTNDQGLNTYQFWGDDKKLLKALLMIKAANFNTIRSIQHMQFSEVRQLQDRLGLMSEQDIGSVTPENQLQIDHLLLTSQAITRECYNNPGVILLSLANETTFEPAIFMTEVLEIDPDRIMVPISGRIHGAKPFVPQKSSYDLGPEMQDIIMESVHPYRGWYVFVGEPWNISRPFSDGEITLIGEYGGEALDGYDTMLKYPESFGATPDKSEDILWGQVQVKKDDQRQMHGSRGKKPKSLQDYIEASQRYQADMVGMITTAARLSPSVNGYIQYHFVDVMPANWAKSIVSFDLRPKMAYYEMSQVNQEVLPLFLLSDDGSKMDVWVSNVVNKQVGKCILKCQVKDGEKVYIENENACFVPRFNYSKVTTIDLSKAASLNDVDISLSLINNDGELISNYTRNVYIAAWRKKTSED